MHDFKFSLQTQIYKHVRPELRVLNFFLLLTRNSYTKKRKISCKVLLPLIYSHYSLQQTLQTLQTIHLEQCYTFALKSLLCIATRSSKVNPQRYSLPYLYMMVLGLTYYGWGFNQSLMSVLIADKLYQSTTDPSIYIYVDISQTSTVLALEHH